VEKRRLKELDPDGKPRPRRTKLSWSSWDYALPDKLIAEMGKGKCYRTACFTLGIKPSTAQEWAKDTNANFRPEWAEAKEIGEVAHLCFLEGISIDMMITPAKEIGSPAILKFLMSSLHKYTDRVESKIETDVVINLPSMLGDTDEI